jgi:hypothetical protein
MGAEKSKLKDVEGEQNVCAANGNEAILEIVLATHRRIIALETNASNGRAIQAHELIRALNLVKETEKAECAKSVDRVL